MTAATMLEPWIFRRSLVLHGDTGRVVLRNTETSFWVIYPNNAKTEAIAHNFSMGMSLILVYFYIQLLFL